MKEGVVVEIILEGYILVAEADLLAVVNELPKHIELTREEVGCLVFEVLQDKESKHKFNVYEKFSSRNAFEFHQQRVSHSKWGEVSANIERHYQINDSE